MDTNPKVQHPYRGRHYRGPSLTGFIEILRSHIFVFRKVVSGFDMNEEQLQNMVNDLDREMFIYRQAWEGGDDFMKALATNMVRQRNELIPRRTEKDSIGEALMAVAGDDVTAYAQRLERFDWFHSFSDDGVVLRNGAAREEELTKIAKTQGGLYQKLWDHYAKKRSDAIAGKKSE